MPNEEDPESLLSVIADLQRDLDEARSQISALESQHADLQALFDRAPTAIFLRDPGGRITFANAEFQRCYGNSPESLHGKTLEQIFPPDQAAAFSRHDREVVERDALVEEEVEVEVAGERRVWASAKFPIRRRGDTRPSIGGIEFDVTERCRAREALKASEKRFRHLVEGLKNDVFFTTIDTQGDVTYVSPSVENVLGYSREECLTHWTKFVTDSLTIETIDRITKMLHSGETPEPFEVALKHRDGSTRVLEVIETPIIDDGGRVIGSEGIYHDITRRKRAERELRENRELLRTMIDNIPARVFLRDRDGRFLIVNKRYEAECGVRDEEIRGRSLFETLDRDEAERFHREDRQVIETGRNLEKEKDVEIGGLPHTLASILFPVRDLSGEIVSVGGIQIDITARKNADKATRKARDEAERALADLKLAQDQLVQAEKMASLGQLTAGIAHEIKNPLNFVNNFAETSVELASELREALQDSLDRLDPDAKDDALDLFETLTADLKTIAKHGRRADQIVKSMLLHARGELSHRTATAINELVDEAMKLAYHGERARDKGFQATLDPQFDADAGELELVPQEMTRVLVNLFSNAFHAVRARSRQAKDPDFQPRVAVSTRGLDDSVEIRVHDNGCGVPEDVRDRVFDPFFTTKPTDEGTGLGLSLAFDIVVQQHGGTIELRSEPDSFTEFVIVLPRRSAEGQAAEPSG